MNFFLTFLTQDDHRGAWVLIYLRQLWFLRLACLYPCLSYSHERIRTRVSESDVHTKVALSLLQLCLWVRQCPAGGQLPGSAQRAGHSARVHGPGIKKSRAQGQQKGQDEQCSVDQESASNMKGKVRKKIRPFPRGQSLAPGAGQA